VPSESISNPEKLVWKHGFYVVLEKKFSWNNTHFFREGFPPENFKKLPRASCYVSLAHSLVTHLERSEASEVELQSVVIVDVSRQTENAGTVNAIPYWWTGNANLQSIKVRYFRAKDVLM